MRVLPAITVLFACLTSALSAAAHEATNAGVTVAHPWARATPGGVTNGVAFLEIRAAAGVADRLVAVSSPASARAELHTHIMDGNVMRMRRVDAIAVTADAPAVLKPHGDHVMLMDLKAPLKEGDLVKLTLTFEKAGPLEVEATIEPIGAMGPHGMNHQPGHEPAMDHSQHKMKH